MNVFVTRPHLQGYTREVTFGKAVSLKVKSYLRTSLSKGVLHFPTFDSSTILGSRNLMNKSWVIL